MLRYLMTFFFYLQRQESNAEYNKDGDWKVKGRMENKDSECLQNVMVVTIGLCSKG